jgi:anti-sigma B factor antagonist
MNFKIDSMKEEDSLSIHLDGDFDMYAAPGIKADLIHRLEAGVRKVIVDMTEVRYLDSSGVGVIVSLVKTARRIGANISFIGLGGNPKKLLERTNLLPLLGEAIA